MLTTYIISDSHTYRSVLKFINTIFTRSHSAHCCFWCSVLQRLHFIYPQKETMLLASYLGGWWQQTHIKLGHW